MFLLWKPGNSLIGNSQQVHWLVVHVEGQGVFWQVGRVAQEIAKRALKQIGLGALDQAGNLQGLRGFWAHLKEKPESKNLVTLLFSLLPLVDQPRRLERLLGL